MQINNSNAEGIEFKWQTWNCGRRVRESSERIDRATVLNSRQLHEKDFSAYL